MTPEIGSRSFWLTVGLVLALLVVWVVGNVTGWDTSEATTALWVFAGAYGVGRAGEWVGRGLGSKPDTTPPVSVPTVWVDSSPDAAPPSSTVTTMEGVDVP